MKVRLKQNVIADGKFYVRDSVIDDELLPAHLKENQSVVTHDLDDRTKAMALKELHYNTRYTDGEGFDVRRPVMLGAGELIDTNQIQPEWKEGTDFKYGWSPEERRAIQDRSEAEYLKQFQPKSEEPYENVIGYHSARKRH
jgi:hypothetical protein